jgi:uncharacterized protein YjaG (DUF416 family)
MADLHFDADALQSTVATLDYRAQVAFALLCTERLYPNYLVFQQDVGWGSSATVRAALDYVWDWLLQAKLSADELEKLLDEVEHAEPDTENFDSLFVSPALDVATATGALLRLLWEPGVAGVVEVASYARDTVDMYIQEVEGMDPQDPHLEETIRLHPTMQRELQNQSDDLRFLSQTKLTSVEVQALCGQKRDLPVSIIGLSPS